MPPIKGISGPSTMRLMASGTGGAELVAEVKASPLEPV